MAGKSFAEALIDYRKHLDVIILSRAAVFSTANALMLFVFRLESPRIEMIVGGFCFGLLSTAIWLAVGVRTSGTMARTTALLEGMESQLAADGKHPALDVGPYLYHRVLRRRGRLRFVSATFVLCYILPLLFLAAWGTLFAIALT